MQKCKFLIPRILNLDRIDISQFIYCYGKELVLSHNCLNINRVTISRVKCLDIVYLKVLPTTCLCYDSEEIKSKFLIPKMKLNRINMSFPMQVLSENVSSILRKWQVFMDLFVHFSRKVYAFISILYKMFLLSYCFMVWWFLQIKSRLLANVSKKEMEGNICSNIAYFVHIWYNSNIACHKKPLKFNLSFIFPNLI